MAPVTVLTCPKCHAPMRTYERGGVHVDQCTECRGVFLDRGELDRLLDAESRTASADHGAYRDYNRSGHHGDDQRDYAYQDHGYRDHQYRDDDHRHNRKKRNILSELFD